MQQLVSQKTADEYAKINFKSIMHNAEEIKKINKAYNMFQQGEEYIVEDENKVEEKTDNEKSQELHIIKEKSKVYLGSILFFSSQNWSVWVNNKLISSDNNSPTNEIFIKYINGKKARIVWSLSPSKWQILMGKNLSENDPRVNSSNMVTTEFSLQNNQSYLLKENSTIEGRGDQKEKTDQ